MPTGGVGGSRVYSDRLDSTCDFFSFDDAGIVPSGYYSRFGSLVQHFLFALPSATLMIVPFSFPEHPSFVCTITPSRLALRHDLRHLRHDLRHDLRPRLMTRFFMFDDFDYDFDSCGQGRWFSFLCFYLELPSGLHPVFCYVSFFAALDLSSGWCTSSFTFLACDCPSVRGSCRVPRFALFVCSCFLNVFLSRLETMQMLARD